MGAARQARYHQQNQVKFFHCHFSQATLAAAELCDQTSWRDVSNSSTAW
jgi:hypothetical protein